MRRYIVDLERPVNDFTVGSLRIFCSISLLNLDKKRIPEKVRDFNGTMLSVLSYFEVTGVTVIFLNFESFFLNVETSWVWMGEE